MIETEAIMVARVAVHLVTIFLLAGYSSRDSRFRLGPSVLAGLILSTSAGMTVHTLACWHQLVEGRPDVISLILAIAIMVPVAAFRGNVAKLYDWFRLTIR